MANVVLEIRLVHVVREVLVVDVVRVYVRYTGYAKRWVIIWTARPLPSTPQTLATNHLYYRAVIRISNLIYLENKR